MLRVIAITLVLCGCASKQQHFTGGAVAADHYLASKAGVEILASGGNAVDAAVATSFALSVVRPFSCGIGGGGFMLIDSPTMDPVALNYRETSPEKVGSTFFTSHDSRIGGTAVGVPGTVAGLLAAHQRYGKLSREQVLAPAIRLARQGFEQDAAFTSAITSVNTYLADHPEHNEVSAAMRNTFGGQDRIEHTGQEAVLVSIANRGASGFYEGEVANAIVMATKNHLTLQDLSKYTPRWEQPLIIDFGEGNTIVAMPPPSSGGVAIGQIVGLLQRIGADEVSQDSPAFAHYLVESMKHAFADRAEHMADAAFVEVPVNSLLDSSYLDTLAQRIRKDRTFDRYAYGSISPPPDDDGTSHLSVVDKSGMTVAVTETINTGFGSLVLVEPFGFMLNNEMDDFSSPSGVNIYGLRQSDKNLPEPGKRPLSSMSPTIVAHHGVPVLVIGASGGPRIISSVVQVLLRVVWGGDDPIDALAHPRLHHQWMPDRVYFEEDFTVRTRESLQSNGHEIMQRGHIGVVQVIQIDDGVFKPASDPRKGGRPAGIN
jgi:gamma-glutamyltranspeptidase/glutathione hydrolase